jgi:two-component system LytT family response regulator
VNTTALRVLIVDDEPLARARSRRLIDQIGGATVVAEASSVAEARERLGETEVDVVLLDVQMPGEDGFALLEHLSPRPAVVFVTAFDQYAVRAFEENATDYLLKPFRAERLAQALDRVRADMGRPDEVADRLQRLLADLGRRGAAPDTLDRFTVRVGQRQRIVKVDEVLWFGAEDKLVFAATAETRHYVNFTLDELERKLDPRRFLRVHRGAIANMEHARELRPGFAGTYRLQLDDEARTEIPVSRARAKKLRERLGA